MIEKISLTMGAPMPKNKFAPTLQSGENMAIAAIGSNLQGYKCFANLENKLWTKIPTSSRVQMNGNLSQIYPVPSLSLKKNIGENYLLICFPNNLNKICTVANLNKIFTVANLMQSRRSTHLHRVAKLV